MSLIKCPECSHEVSEYAEECPCCKQKLSKEIKKDLKSLDSCNEDYEKKDFSFKQAKKEEKSCKRSRRKFIYIILLVILVIVVDVGISMKKNDKNDDQVTDYIEFYEAQMRDETKFYESENDNKMKDHIVFYESENDSQIVDCFEFYESLLGRKLNKNEELNLNSFYKSYIEDCVLFNMIGDVTLKIPTINPEYVIGVVWTSQQSCSNIGFITILRELEKIYGEHKGVDRIKEVKDSEYSIQLDSVFTWKKDDLELRCWRDKKNKVKIEWARG